MVYKFFREPGIRLPWPQSNWAIDSLLHLKVWCELSGWFLTSTQHSTTFKRNKPNHQWNRLTKVVLQPQTTSLPALTLGPDQNTLVLSHALFVEKSVRSQAWKQLRGLITPLWEQTSSSTSRHVTRYVPSFLPSPLLLSHQALHPQLLHIHAHAFSNPDSFLAMHCHSGGRGHSPPVIWGTLNRKTT